jgi:outer membrane lipoprotein SlyB|tara:strand:+ start:5141 stop:6250 length:1110 start_codon:yes stop_codon:yes gene_type:complete
MGTLRIKRGTKTALQTSPGYTPVEGELVYTTDTKEVFVGDGTTTGGTPVSVASQNLEDLGNVQALTPIKDQILVYNGSNWAATGNPALDIRGNIYGDDSTLLVDAINGQIVGPINTTSIVSSGNIVGNLVGDVVGGVTGNLVGNTTGTHYGNVFGTLDGDITGSVFGDDSSVLVDGTNNIIRGRIDNPNIITTKITVNTEAGEDAINLVGAVTNSVGTRLVVNSSRGTIEVPTVVIGGSDGDGLMDLHGTGWDGNSYALAGIVRVGVDLDATVADGVVPGRINFITANSSGSLVNLLTFNSAGNLGIGLPRPLQKLHVNGNAQVNGFVQFGSLTTTERDALTAANGMVIYNSTDNKFQGRENGAWVNLV